MSDTTDNEITAAVRKSNEGRKAADRTGGPAEHSYWPIATVGIGSAALAAAVLYASKWRH